MIGLSFTANYCSTVIHPILLMAETGFWRARRPSESSIAHTPNHDKRGETSKINNDKMKTNLLRRKKEGKEHFSNQVKLPQKVCKYKKQHLFAETTDIVQSEGELAKSHITSQIDY